MKKSNFVALVLGTISGVFFALGMCMALLPEWDAFRPGVGLGCIGAVLALITVFVWRRMEHKQPLKITGKSVLIVLIALVGSLALGLGMVNVIVWANLVRGIIIGLVGIVALLMLIPICKGLK
ncbi:MAG: hypothetical protein PHC41_09020 [Lachnospiraceae bacterium]|nr:hypothetical protein [Lachnospiraceae bacterium]MDD3616350.1 hypothetical protein [Lachnospiraceae bacterium]